MNRTFTMLGAANGFLAVAAGAFGAHALKARLSVEHLASWETASHYHLIHAVMLVLVGTMLGPDSNSRMLPWAGRFFMAGIVLFSGSLYLLAVSGVRKLGIVTPFGGLCFLAGWLMLAIAANKISHEPKN
jgi:uncharacterized membrane protein YgdD (TMEM256/DUF423 family)